MWQGKSGSDLKLPLISSCVLSCTLVFFLRKMNWAPMLVGEGTLGNLWFCLKGSQKQLVGSFEYCWLFWFLKIDILAGKDRHATMHGNNFVVCHWSGSNTRLGLLVMKSCVESSRHISSQPLFPRPASQNFHRWRRQGLVSSPHTVPFASWLSPEEFPRLFQHSGQSLRLFQNMVC